MQLHQMDNLRKHELLPYFALSSLSYQ